MKSISIISLCALSVILSLSCKKVNDYNEPTSTDMTKPNPPTNIRVTNFKGGAYIIYSLPKTVNTLYVLADYMTNDSTGAVRQTKTSYYTDTTIVEGFAEKKEYTVTLKTVTRANVESDPVTVKVFPDTPVYKSIYNSVVLQPTFGGVNANAANPTSKGITLVYMYNDPVEGKYVIREQKYFDAANINYVMRGFDTLPKQFGVYVTDRWGNKSPVKYATIKPWYEFGLNKTLFSVYSLPTDIPTQGGYPKEKMWDGITNSYNSNNFWHSQFDPTLNPPPIKPYTVSFSMGQTARLSRFTLWQRQWGDHYWLDGAIQTFTLWGSASNAPSDANLPATAPEGTVVGDWINIGNFDFPTPPSGASTSSPTAADRQWWDGGVDFQMPVNIPKVKYLRFATSKTWGDREGTYITELSFFGGN